MTVLTEGTHAGEFIVSEGENNYSRDLVVIASGQNLPAGRVLGKITASGKWVGHDPAATNGSENAAGILFDAVDASAADANGVAIVRHAQVNGKELVHINGISNINKAAAATSLAVAGIIVR